MIPSLIDDIFDNKKLFHFLSHFNHVGFVVSLHRVPSKSFSEKGGYNLSH